MKKTTACFLIIILLVGMLPVSSVQAAQPAQNLAPDVVTYDIDVTLDVEGGYLLEGVETVTYRNTTQTDIPDLVFHLYLNAFENEDTIFMQEGGPMHRGNQWVEAENGWIEVTGLRLLDGTELTFEELEDGTLARAALPELVEPGELVSFELTFRAKLPKVFARTDWATDASGDPFVMVGQWFPKLGVWQDTGWNAYPFHANAEFFADFGTYDVTITLPEGYMTGATGMPVETGLVETPSGMQTVAYHAEDVIDFAWTASPNFQTATRTVGTIEVLYLYLPEHDWTAERVLDAAELAVNKFGAWYGPYPYPRLTIVDVPDEGEGAGGMEYPTLITAGAMDITGLGSTLSKTGVERGLELVVIHEAGHQWWMGMVAFNEAEEPWLDEGFTDYSTMRLLNEVYGVGESAIDAGNLDAGYLDMRRMEYVAFPGVPMYGNAWEFGGLQYGIAAYSKPALSLLTLQNVLGVETMDRIMKSFFTQHQFSHPTTEDFQAVVEQEAAGQDLIWFFGGENFGGLLYGVETVNYSAQSIDGNSITIAREGDLPVPVDVLVQLADGASTTLVWDGAEPERTIEFDQPVESFQIDPQRKVLVELVWSDNGLASGPRIADWLTAVTRLLYHLQNWLLTVGGL